jgi:hypothetical protein
MSERERERRRRGVGTLSLSRQLQNFHCSRVKVASALVLSHAKWYMRRHEFGSTAPVTTGLVITVSAHRVMLGRTYEVNVCPPLVKHQRYCKINLGDEMSVLDTATSVQHTAGSVPSSVPDTVRSKCCVSQEAGGPSAYAHIRRTKDAPASATARR